MSQSRAAGGKADRDNMTEAERKEAELEEFYAHQKKAMDKRLEMVFWQINGAAHDKPELSPKTSGSGMRDNQQDLMKFTLEHHEIEETLLKLCKMSPKQVAACTRGPADNPVKPLDQVPYIEDMIWEGDETGDGLVNIDEFKRCYERAKADRTGFEPRKLATLVDFLLMDEENLGFVTEDQISELMTARYGTWQCFSF